MTSNQTARWVGALFLLATAAYLTGSGLVNGVLNEPEFLSRLAAEKGSMTAGLFLEMVNSAAVIGIAALLFPILKVYDEGIAAIYLGSRIVESILLLAGTAVTFVLLSGNESPVDGAAGLENGVWPAALGMLAVNGREISFQLAMLSLASGSILFCWLLYRQQLIPRLLALLGLAGYAALLASSCLSLSGYEAGSVLFIPGAIFEIVFPVWLLVKGSRSFSRSGWR